MHQRKYINRCLSSVHNYNNSAGICKRKFSQKCFIFIEHSETVWYNTNRNWEFKIRKLKVKNQPFLASNGEIRDTRYKIRDKSIILHHKSQCFKHFSVLVANKAPKKHLFSWLHKWGIANDPAVVAERFTEACFVERFGRRRQSWPKNPCNPWLINDLRLRKITYEIINFFCKTNPNSEKVKWT